jgi:mRNA interferase RelE/StbE
MAYILVYNPEVKTKDVPKLKRDVGKRIQRAIETRLAAEPERYGEPLRRTLKGYWKLRFGDYRVVFRIVKTKFGSSVLCTGGMFTRELKNASQ